MPKEIAHTIAAALEILVLLALDDPRPFDRNLFQDFNRQLADCEFLIGGVA